MVPKLSEEAWALLGILHRANQGDPRSPVSLEKAYAELQAQGLGFGLIITSKGEEALRERYLSSPKRRQIDRDSPKRRYTDRDS